MAVKQNNNTLFNDYYAPATEPSPLCEQISTILKGEVLIGRSKYKLPRDICLLNARKTIEATVDVKC